MTPDPPAERPEARILVAQLERGCRRLAESLAELEAAAPEELADRCAAHLEEVRRLRPGLSAVAAALGDHPARAECAAHRRRMGECAGLLRRAAEAYARLGGRASAELSRLDGELARMQCGTRAFRTYRHAAR